MGRGYTLTQTGAEVQEILDEVEDKTVYGLATQSEDGLMSHQDKAKLDDLDIPSPGTNTPLMDGTGSSGSSTNYARADHRHPSDTKKQDLIDSNHKLDYSLLTNTPAIPPAQIQSDWNQTNTSAKDYIKNKPVSLEQIQSDWNQTNTSAKDYIKNKPTIPDELSDLSDDSTHRLVTDTEKATWNSKYTKPQNGIPGSDLAEGVIPDVSDFITKTVDDLTNYYTKSQTYTQSEVNSLIAGISGFEYEVVATLPTASASTMHKIYLVPSSDPQIQNVKDEYITLESSGSYSWEQIGSTAIDLSGYVTTSDLNTALANYQPLIDSTHKLDYSLLDNTPTIPAAGIPAGGNAGQVLTKTDGSTDYAVAWRDTYHIYPSAYCTTSASTAIKSAACTFWTATANSYLYILITNANTNQGALSLNVNSTGAKPIYINGTVSGSSNYTLPAGSYIVFYDGTNYYFRTDGKLTASITGETDPTVPSWAKQSTKPTYTASEVGALPDSTVIPDDLADLNDDSTHRLVTDTQISTWNNKSDFSGSYNDLANKPTIPAAQVNSDWNASSGVAQILNKPTIPTALSQLSEDTTHRVVTDTEKSTWNSKTSNIGTITGINMNGASKGTSGVVDLGTVITAHQDISGKADKNEMSVTTSGDQTTITLKSGTSATVINAHQSLSSKQDTLVSGTNIKTINGNSVLGSGNLSTFTPIVNHGTSDTTYTLPPNELHIWGTISALTISLGTPTDNTIVNEYMIEFTSGSTATTLSLPSSVEWAESCGSLSVEASKTYQISIVNNIGLWCAV